MDEMDYNFEIARLESNAKLVKILAKIAISSTAFTVVILLFGFDLPNPVIFLTILLVPILFALANNNISKYYAKKIEYIANDLLIQDLEEGNETDAEFPKRDSNYPNIDHLRNRGGDEKGPAFGSDNKQFSTHGKRVDAMKNRDYDDIESVTTEGEQMLKLADEIQSEKSAQHWQDSESKDQDITEAGVKNLGELVKSGWFEKNRQEGAVKQLYENNEGNQI